jgi:hypothetical protein
VPLALPRLRLGKALEPDAFELARRRMAGEAGEELLETPPAVADAPLGRRRRGHDEVGALEADRVVAGAEEETLDDAPELDVRSSLLRQVAEEATQARVGLPEAAVDDDQAEVVLGGEEMVEALGEDMSPVPYVSSGLPKNSGKAFGPSSWSRSVT